MKSLFRGTCALEKLEGYTAVVCVRWGGQVLYSLSTLLEITSLVSESERAGCFAPFTIYVLTLLLGLPGALGQPVRAGPCLPAKTQTQFVEAAVAV